MLATLQIAFCYPEQDVEIRRFDGLAGLCKQQTPLCVHVVQNKDMFLHHLGLDYEYPDVRKRSKNDTID